MRVGAKIAFEGGAFFEPGEHARRVLLIKMTMKHGTPQIAVDEERRFAVAGKSAGDVARNQGFAFAGNGTRDQKRFGIIQFGVYLYRAVDAQKRFYAGRLVVA